MHNQSFFRDWAKIPFAPIAIAFGVGILAASATRIPLFGLQIAFAAMGLAAVLTALGRRNENKIFAIVLLFLFVISGMLRYRYWQTSQLEAPFLAHLPLQMDEVSGVIKSVQKGKRWRAIVNVQQLQRDSIFIETDSDLLVYFPYRFQQMIPPGKHVQLRDVQIETLSEARNPGQFDYGKYLRSRGIVAQCRVRDSLQIVILPNAADFSLENVIFSPARRYLSGKLDAHFSPQIAGLIKALLLGIREDLARDIREDFQNAGVMHVLAISGLHVGFVALIIIIFLSFFPVYFKTRNWLTIILLAGYMLLTGSNPPVVRATLMATLLFLSINLERRKAVPNFLFAAGFIILLCQPQQLFWVGFQFSFAAVLAIIYFYPKILPWFDSILDRIDREQTRTLLTRWLITPVAITFAAQIGTVPLVMHYFHKFSLISFALNIVVIPFIGALVAVGFLFLTISLFSSVSAGLIANLLEFFLKILITSVHFAANLPTAYFHIPAFGWLEIFAFLTIVLLIFNWRRVRLRRFYTVAAMLLLIANPSLHLFEKPALDLLVLDVSQGDAALVRTPQQKIVLIDTGPANEDWSSADWAIIPAMQNFDTKHIDRLFISHPHLDHFGGTFRLLNYASIDTVYLPPIPIVEPMMDSLLQIIDQRNIPRRTLRNGDVISIDSETRVYVLGPFAPLSRYDAPSGKNVNNNSLVLLMKHREQSLLFPGDAEAEAEAYLRQWGKLLKSDVLKVGHHGSRTSSTPGFLSLVKPTYATISVGKYNRFGHPNANILRRLRTLKTQMFRTDEDKAIWLRFQDRKWERIQWDR